MQQKTKEKGGTKILKDGGLFVLKYAETQVLVIRPPTYHDAILRARNHFEDISDLSTNRIRFKTDKFKDGTSIPDTEISEAAWPAVIKHLTGVEVFIKCQKEVQPLTMTVVSNFYGHQHSYKVQESTTGQTLLTAIYGCLGFSYQHNRIRIMYDGRRISPDDTILSLGIRDRGNIDVYMGQTGGHRPGIFLLGSLPLQVEVSLQLSNSWGGSGYPLNTVQNFQWTVNYEGDKERYPSVDWLAKMDQPSPEAELDLNNDNSVVFPVTSGEGFIDYISSVFRTLGFPEKFYETLECRIIALFGDHSHIAIRFLSPEELEQHAKLTITPEPNDEIRIIMLYKLLGDEDITHWQDAIKRRDLGPSYWANKAGLPESGVQLLDNKDLLQVLDWGMLKVR